MDVMKLFNALVTFASSSRNIKRVIFLVTAKLKTHYPNKEDYKYEEDEDN